MGQASRRRPSPALAISVLALFVALGGTGYAAIRIPRNSVRSLQVANGSLQTVDLSRKARASLKSIAGLAAGGSLSGRYPKPAIKNGAITTPKFAAGAVAPNANLLDGIDSTGFLPANGKAADADKLDGQSSSAFVPSCPAGTTRVVEFCVSALGSTTTWNGAYFACDNLNPSMRLPTMSELGQVQRALGPAEDDWTTDVTDVADAMSVQIAAGFTVTFHERPLTNLITYRCISTPLATATGSGLAGAEAAVHG
jgi:hypothetical protein